jgi:hypothetical protein
MLRKTTQWIVDHLLWNAGNAARTGFWGGLWATRRLLVALALSAVLTWREWVEHHPPEIAIVAAMHFALVMLVIALLVYTAQWFRRSDRKASKRQKWPPENRASSGRRFVDRVQRFFHQPFKTL